MIGVARVGRLVLTLVVAVGMMPAVAWGAGWVIQPTPQPPGESINLSGVSCLSVSACTAVGDYYNQRGVERTLAERWDGMSWTIEATVDPPETSSDLPNGLSGVSCPSASVCTAVGFYSGSGSGLLPLVERREGASWALQAIPMPPDAGGELSGVSCPSVSACIAVGTFYRGDSSFTLVEQWDGTAWTVQPTPNPANASGSDTHLVAVSCLSASTCAAVGWYIDTRFGALALAERWDGKTWAIQRTPSPAGSIESHLTGVSCPSAMSCTAVGNTNSGTGPVALAERWNGTSWKVQRMPDPGIPSGVSCPSVSVCTAVSETEADRWEGTSWAVQSIPIPPDASAPELSGVSCPSVTACTAVGSGLVGGLIATWTGPGAPSVSIRSPTQGARYTPGQVAIGSTTAARKPRVVLGSLPAWAQFPNGSPSDHHARAGRGAFTVTATSKDGRRASRTVSYTIRPSNPAHRLAHRTCSP